MVYWFGLVWLVGGLVGWFNGLVYGGFGLVGLMVLVWVRLTCMVNQCNSFNPG